MPVPDIEKLVSDHLRGYLGVRVVGQPPASKDTSWIQVVQLNASQGDQADHLVEFYLQLDCYAGKDGGQPEANQLARQARAVLVNLNGKVDYTVGGNPESAVIGRIEINGDARIPDGDFEPSRERRILTCSVWGHSTSA